jgi:hypothetical protein
MVNWERYEVPMGNGWKIGNLRCGHSSEVMWYIPKEGGKVRLPPAGFGICDACAKALFEKMKGYMYPKVGD